MADEIAEVFITIRPRTAGFKQEAESELRGETPDVQAKVTPNIDQAAVTRIKASLDDLSRRAASVKVGVDDKGANAKLLAIKASLLDLDHKTATATMDVRGAAHAEADIAAVDAKLDAIGRKSVTAKVNVDSSPASRAIGGIATALAALAPAAIPVAAGVTAVVGAAAASFLSAGAGIGALAIAYKGATKIIQGDLKALQTAQLNVQTAQAAVDSAKGPKARATAIQNLTAAQKTLNGVTASFSPAEKTLVGDTNKITVAFTAWERSSGMPALAKIYDHALPLLHSGLKLLTPLVGGAAGAIVQLEQGAEKAVNGSFGKHFIGLITKDAPGAIVALGRSLGNIGKGFVGIIEAFEPFHKQLQGGLEDLTSRFAKWGASLGGSKGFKDFIAYVRDNGPQVGKLLAAIGLAIAAVIKAGAGFGAAEFKTITSVLQNITSFATHHPDVAKMAVAVLALAKAAQLLKLATIGGSIAKVVSSLATKAIAPAVTGATSAASSAVVGGSEGAVGGGILSRIASLVRGGSAASRLSSVVEIAGGGAAVGGALGLVIGPLILSFLNKNFVKQSHDVGNGPSVTDPNTGKTTNFPHPAHGGGGAGGAYRAAKLKAAQETADNTRKIKENTGTGVGTSHAGNKDQSSLFGATKVPFKVLISGDAVAAQKLLQVQKVLGGIPKNKDIRIGTPTVATVQGELANVALATHGLPTSKVIKVSAPGGNLTALSLLNISRAARGLPLVKKVNVSSPGVTGALENINTLAHQMGLLPKNKSIVTSTPGSKTAILDMINLDRHAHGLPPLKKIPTSAPGADKAVQQLIALAVRAELIPKVKQINTAAPGAQDAINHINTLLIRAGLLPKGKSIPTSVPGAQDAILHYIDLYEKAHHLPISKSIPTSVPGAPASIQNMINLATRIGLVPKTHSTTVSTPGAAAAKAAIDDLHTTLKNFPAHFKTTIDAVGNVSFGGTGVKANAEGGYIRGPGGPKSDSILSRLSNGEFVQPAASVAHYGTAAMEAVRQRKADIVPRFADGGHVNTALVIQATTHGLKDIKTKLLTHDQQAVVASVKNLFASGLGLGGGGGGGADSWIPVVAQALAMLHQPVGLAPLWAHSVIANESGGNALAVNRTDINAQEGHPSVGGNQVIAGTFDAYAGPFRNVGPFISGVSVNRLANTFAALNYAIHAYGGIANVPGIRSLQSGGGYRPYATGGPVPGSGNGDTVPAMLTPGEFVLNKGAVSKVGMGILHAINGGMGSGNGFFHAGGPVLGIHYGASGDWVKALAIQARMLKDAFHLGKWDGRLSTTLGADWPNHEPHALPKLAKFDPTVKRLVSYLWGRHGKPTTFDDALAHFNHGENPMAFLDLMRAYDAGKGYLTEFKGKGKGRHRFIPDSTLAPFRSGLRRYEGLYHHDVQALQHKIMAKPENGSWGSSLDGPVKHVIAHALHKAHSDFLARPWAPLSPGEKALQAALTANSQAAALRKDQDQFGKWGLVDLVQTLAGEDIATSLPIANSAVKNRGLATKLNAAYRVADTSTLGGHFVNQGFLSNSGGYAGFARGGYPKPGWAWAGEHGPELVKFKGTERVYPADQSKRMGGGDIDYERLARTITRATGARSGPLIEHATFTDNTDVQLAMQRIVFAEQTAGLAAG